MVLTHTLGWGQKIDFVLRTDWGARKADLAGIGSSRLPFVHVVYNYSGYKLCSTRGECAKAVRTIQADQMEGGAPDIYYNFMVGGDGFIYKCRGWFLKPTILEGSSDPESTLYVGFVGNFENRDLTFLMSVTALKLIKYGIRKLYIKPSFHLTTLKRYEVNDVEEE